MNFAEPVNILNRTDDDIGCFTFFARTSDPIWAVEPWFQHLLEALDPFTRVDEERAKAAEKVINEVLPDDDKVKGAWGEPCVYRWQVV